MDSHHPRMCSMAGERIVAMVLEDLKPRDICTRSKRSQRSEDGACHLGSTNACVHLPAMAGRLGIALPLAVWEKYKRSIPVLANLMPAGTALMEDFFFARRAACSVEANCTASGHELPQRLWRHAGRRRP